MVDDRSVTLTVAGATDVGRKRQRNEDSLRWYIAEPGSPLAAFGAVMLVCDGMGGVGQGDLASQTAVEKFFSVYLDENFIEPDVEKRVQRALETAHTAVRDAAALLGRLYIGTTAAGLVMRPDGAVLVFNLGDSRVYRLRGGDLTLVSKDQSVNAAQLERGDITPEQALAARNMNITMFIGHPLEMTPVYVHLNAEPGDVFMLCSDGLWDVLPEQQLKDILISQPPEQAVKTYIDQTLRAGAPDNVTAVVASTRQYKPRRRWWPFALVLLVLLGAGAYLLATNLSGCCGPQPSPTPSVTSDSDVTSNAVIVPAGTQAPLATVVVGDTEPGSSPTAANTSTSLVAVEVLASDTPRPSRTPTDTPLPTATRTSTASPTASGTPTETTTPTGTVTRRPTRTATPTSTLTPSQTTSNTAAPSATRTPSATKTATRTVSPTQTATSTATMTSTASLTPSRTPSPTITPTSTPLPSATPTRTATPPATPSFTPSSTSNVAFWVLKGTPTSALALVTVVRYNALNEPPVQIYIGNIERRFNSVTEVDPLNPGSKYVLVYLRPKILDGHRFWWLVEDVQPQFEVLTEAGIRVYITANFSAPQRSPIPIGELVIVTGKSPDGQWFKIRSRRGDGWVARGVLDNGWVRFLGDENDIPVVIPPPLGGNPPPATSTPESPPTQDPGNGNPPPATPVPPPTNQPQPSSAPPTNQPPTNEPPTPEPPTPEPPTPEPPTSEPIPPEPSPTPVNE